MNSHDAAALWGSAENVVYPTKDRLKMALQALDFFGKEYEEKEDLHLTTEHESRYNHPADAIGIVEMWAKEGLGVPEDTFFYLVWFCFILGGWKALVSSTEPDGRYYEVTYNKEKSEAYVDTYRKTHNHAVTIIHQEN